MYYSPSTGGFYSTAVHGKSIPSDKVEVPADAYAALIEGQASGLRIAPDDNGFPILTAQASATPTSDTLCAQVDLAADSARRAVVGDPLRSIEYERSAAEALAFKEAGYPGAAVPRTVAAWAISGRTAQQAADNILAEAAAYTEALYQLREARLKAKELIRNACAGGDLDSAQDIAAETIASIEAAIAGVGNAAT